MSIPSHAARLAPLAQEEVPRQLVLGHRGASGYRPEHTEAAYRLACELGADAVEPDVVASRDGVLIVRHENEISSTTNVADHPEFANRRTTKIVDGQRKTGWFTEDFTWHELSKLRCRERMPNVRPENCAFDDDEPILRLRDVLAIVDAEASRHGRQIRAVVEVKHASYFLARGIDLGALLIDELVTTGWDGKPEQLIIESFELSLLDRLRAAGVQAEFVFLTEETGSPVDEGDQPGPARSFAWYRSDEGLDLLATRVDGVSVGKGSVIRVDAGGIADGTTDLVQRAHGRGLRIYTWTLRPENRFLNLRYRSSEGDAEWGDWRGEFALVLSSGVDGVFVDHTELGVEATKAARTHNLP